MIKIGQASRDERGKYSGGKAGDQDGQEVAIRSWYNRPWNKIL
jgi:gametolysin